MNEFTPRKEPEFTSDFEGNIVCPYCVHEHDNSLEIEPEDQEGKVLCVECGKVFFVTVATFKHYTSICEDHEPCEYIDDPTEAHPDHQICKRCGRTNFKRFNKKFKKFPI